MHGCCIRWGRNSISQKYEKFEHGARAFVVCVKIFCGQDFLDGVVLIQISLLCDVLDLLKKIKIFNYFLLPKAQDNFSIKSCFKKDSFLRQHSESFLQASNFNKNSRKILFTLFSNETALRACFSPFRSKRSVLVVLVVSGFSSEIIFHPEMV